MTTPQTRSDLPVGPLPLPETGVQWNDLQKELAMLQAGDAKWRDGRVFGIYFPTRGDIEKVAEAAHSTFFRLSTHHPEVFPSLFRLEQEVVAMAANLFAADDSIGNVTSGGTESIILALKAARDQARAERGITAPELVVARTAYPAFVKAGDLLNVKAVRIPIDAAFRADVRALRNAVNANTILIAASVPTITHGVSDPVREMAALAQQLGINFHVDASLGGFQLPFLRKLGHPVPEFDFTVPGVTTLSADLHKYGYSPMGASVLLHGNAATYKYQGFAVPEWTGGTYRTPGVLGSRSGGGIAAAWAVMRYLGQEGYLNLTRILWETTQRFIKGIERIAELKVIGQPQTSVLVYSSQTLDMQLVAKGMELKGWSGRPQADPPSIRLLLAPYHAEIVDNYLMDLESVVMSVRNREPLTQKAVA